MDFLTCKMLKSKFLLLINYSLCGFLLYSHKQRHGPVQNKFTCISRGSDTLNSILVIFPAVGILMGTWYESFNRKKKKKQWLKHKFLVIN